MDDITATYTVTIRSQKGAGKAPQVYSLAPTRTRAGRFGLKRLLDPGHFRHVVLEHVLDPGLQRGRRRRATRAGAAHVQPDHAGGRLELAEHDVAAVLGHGR